MLLLGLLSTARFAAVYAELAGETWRREIPMAAWIRANLPPGVAIANAATSVEYLTGHRSLNLHGVTSPAFVGNRTAEREAGLFESLGRLPAASGRPTCCSPGRVRRLRAAAGLHRGPPVFATTSFGDDLLLFRARWDLLDRGEEPALPDALAAAGRSRRRSSRRVRPRDEAAHGYRYDSRRGELLLGGLGGDRPAAGG